VPSGTESYDNFFYGSFMFSSSTAASTKAMRPGLFTGSRPEREERHVGQIEHLFNTLRGKMMGLTVNCHGGLCKVVEAVNHSGEALTHLDDQALDQRVVQLRRQFQVHGLTDALTIQAMALIREVSQRTLGLRHYDSQVMAGWVMLQGRLAEMETGEGKTLAATLPAATAALAGIPVHIITVNEYLVERDAEIMGPLCRRLGLTVGYVNQAMTDEERQSKYACDITYCTNFQVAFDYLRDRLQQGNRRNKLRQQLTLCHADRQRSASLMLRGLCFAIVDEADSVLIDDARTPLIITRTIDSRVEHRIYRQALATGRQLKSSIDFFHDTVRRTLRLSRIGQERLSRDLPGAEGVWRNARHREELIGKALHALYLLRKDRDYLICEDKVVIIDANTGRPMPDRSWEQGLHQMVEAKEGCPLTDAREQLGRITYQRFFRRYLRLAGMSGTAREVGSEIWSVYGLRVQRIPLHRPSLRKAFPTQVYLLMEEKWSAVIASVLRMNRKGRPVLIGTGSVAESEILSRRLNGAGIVHQVLNARQDRAEATIVAAAGRRGHVTVATNMAGRGTDIPLGKGVSDLGGLHVIAVCRNEAQRIDRQLFGRSARHGDPGSHEALLSLEDELFDHLRNTMLNRFLMWICTRSSPFKTKLILYLMRRSQRRIERRHRTARKALLAYDRQNDRLLSFSGNME